MKAGEDPALALTQRDNRVRVELAQVKALVAALTNADADLVGVLAGNGTHHA